MPALLVLLVFMVLGACSSPKHSYPDIDYSSTPPARTQYQPPQPTYTPPTPTPVPVQPVEVKQEVHSPVTGKDFVVSDLIAKMGRIDDIGFLFVRHGDGSLVLAQSAAWKYGVSGSASVSIKQYLESGTNLLIFALYSHQAKVLPFGQAVLSKWSYEFSLFGDGTALWNYAEEGKETKNGVVAWQVFSVTSSNGQLTVSKATDSQLALLKPAFASINANFLKTPVSENVADISAAIAVGIRTGTAGN
jgi:hypothetical protein